MSNSTFLIACALAEDAEERPDTLLALTEDEQRTLYDRVAFLDRCGRAMYERLPGIDLSMFDALAFLERAVELRATARRREPHRRRHDTGASPRLPALPPGCLAAKA